MGGMNEWMDEWMGQLAGWDEWMGWMNGWDEWMGWMDEWINSLISIS